MIKDSNFEILLYLAASKYAEEEIEEFLNCDVSAYPITPEIRKRAEKIINKSGKKRVTVWQAVRIALVACLVCMSIAFTACMCIPEIRNAIKKVFVEWYDEYMAIGFGDAATADTTPPYIEEPTTTPTAETTTEAAGETTAGNTTTQAPMTTSVPTERTAPSKSTANAQAMTLAPIETTAAPAETTEPTVALPQYIEQKAYATYLPDGYIENVKMDSEKYYILLYKFNGNSQFSLRQIPIDKYLIWADSTDKNITKESVNGFMAILTKDANIENKYTLVWQTNEYEMFLTGMFESKDQMLRIAEGIRVK